MRILGIDPGTNLYGFGCVLVLGKKVKLIEFGTGKIDSELNQIEKLHQIYSQINQLITRLDPDVMAIESPFFGKNVQSMLKLGRAQGVSIAAGLNAGIKVFEYSPKKIKKAVTGNGNASKEQVARMLPHLLGTEIVSAYFDATDALAAAICHSQQFDLSGENKKFRDWKSFASQNASRVKTKN